MSVLIVGSKGQLGHALVATAPDDVQVAGVDLPDLDITDLVQVRQLLARHRPSVIVNASAYTAVDQAEEEPDLARAVNVEGPRHLALAANEFGARLIHVSTDYVFDGEASSPYTPDAMPNPLGVYGQTKLDGEMAVGEILPGRHVIVRTAWLYSADGTNFVKTILNRVRDNGSLKVVADQRGSPTWAVSLAGIIWKFAARPDISGVYHYTDDGEATWHEFATAIQDEALSIGLLDRRVPVQPITAEEYPVRARRPGYSVLDCSSTHELLGSEPVHWRVNLREMLETTAG